MNNPYANASQEMENYLHQQLATLRRDYERAAKPIIAELVKLQAMQPMPPIYIDLLALPPEQRTFIESLVQKGLK